MGIKQNVVTAFFSPLRKSHIGMRALLGLLLAFLVVHPLYAQVSNPTTLTVERHGVYINEVNFRVDPTAAFTDWFEVINLGTDVAMGFDQYYACIDLTNCKQIADIITPGTDNFYVDFAAPDILHVFWGEDMPDVNASLSIHTQDPTQGQTQAELVEQLVDLVYWGDGTAAIDPLIDAAAVEGKVSFSYVTAALLPPTDTLQRTKLESNGPITPDPANGNFAYGTDFEYIAMTEGAPNTAFGPYLRIIQPQDGDTFNEGAPIDFQYFVMNFDQNYVNGFDGNDTVEVFLDGTSIDEVETANNTEHNRLQADYVEFQGLAPGTYELRLTQKHYTSGTTPIITLQEIINFEVVAAPPDADGDGLPFAVECPLGTGNCVDTDGDGLENWEDPDDDGDGILTINENPDPNGDGSVADAQDTDGDGSFDYVDADDDGDRIGTLYENPDPNSDGDPADAQNTDSDALPDYLDVDDDGDGIHSIYEQAPALDDLDPVDARDFDGDGIKDYLDEDDDGDSVFTIHENPDANGDGEPSDAQDSDPIAGPDYLDIDDDNDGVWTIFEGADPNGDGSPADADNEDGDALPNYLDADDDGDGLPTNLEQADPNGDGNPDDALRTHGATRPDYLDWDNDGDLVSTLYENPDPNGDGDLSDAQDTDGDGTPDYLDRDDDGDGIFGDFENPDPNNDQDVADAQDSDGDGIADYLDIDDDGDSVHTEFELADPDGDNDPSDADDKDSDGIPNYLDEDDDGDGVHSIYEDPDPNGDGNPDDARNTFGAIAVDFMDRNDDNDGIYSLHENPDPNGDGNPDDAQDTDADGIPDYLDKDDDGDGLESELENQDPDADKDPADAVDTDNDGTPDYLDTDDDGDLILTSLEDADPNGDADPSDAADADADGIPNYLDDDDDNDGLSNLEEGADPNGDGDYSDALDTDNDGIPNYLDTDDDGSNVDSVIENDAPNNGDANDDGTPDSEQNNVASFPHAETSMGYVTMESQGDCADFVLQGTLVEGDVATQDIYYDYPFGLIDYELTCGDLGEMSDVTLLIHEISDPAGLVFRKYGPVTPGSTDIDWYDYPATFGTTVIGGQTVVMVNFSLTDGIVGDDSIEDGMILDPLGIGVETGEPTPTPTMTPTPLFPILPTATEAVEEFNAALQAAPTNTATPTTTPSATATATNTATPAATATITNTPTATLTPTNTATAAPGATNTPTPTNTAVPTTEPTNTATATPAPTATPSPTATVAPTLENISTENDKDSMSKLFVDVRANKTISRIGNDIVYKISVMNDGNDVANNVVLRTGLPKELDYIGGFSSQGRVSFDNAKREVFADLDTLEAGELATITVTAKVNEDAVAGVPIETFLFAAEADAVTELQTNVAGVQVVPGELPNTGAFDTRMLLLTGAVALGLAAAGWTLLFGGILSRASRDER